VSFVVIVGSPFFGQRILPTCTSRCPPCSARAACCSCSSPSSC
jgi:hypothetical protein